MLGAAELRRQGVDIDDIQSVAGGNFMQHEIELLRRDIRKRIAHRRIERCVVGNILMPGCRHAV